MTDLRWKMVTCRRCRRSYRCTPDEDYYRGTTPTNGLCWKCLLVDGGLKDQPEPKMGEERFRGHLFDTGAE